MTLTDSMNSVRMLDDSSLSRHVIVAPGMCGGGSLIFGRIGDWTWEAVAAACRTNVHGARNPDGDPAYLSFYYFHVRGGRTIHPHGLAFGDELQVSSRVFEFGSQSVLTLHRLAPAGLGLADVPLAPEEFYERPHPDCLYAENFNRWISRSRPGHNGRLVEVAPPDFSYRHLPRLPNNHSPRTFVGRSREAGSFYPGGVPGFSVVEQSDAYTYELDVARDLNGAGLVYFAAYFSIFDTALLSLWRSLGRSDAQFLRRKVTDQKLAYFGNADADAVFSITARRWRSATRPEIEIADMAMRDVGTGRLLAIAGIEIEVAGLAS
jgi:probable biosynthetic protein (TIGR04098 family)